MKYWDIENAADEYEYQLDELNYINEMQEMGAEAPSDEEMERMARALA